MWVPEFFGTFAYVTKHPEARACRTWDDPRAAKPYRAGDPCIAMDLNLDMVGEDTVKTVSRFYITRTPDSVDGFLNGLMADVMQQTREAYLIAPTGTHNYWPAEVAPYAQGSDHDVFIGMGIPAAMLGHDPDWTHHTSEDTPDKTDASEFRRVGVLAGAAAYWAASADDEGRLRLDAAAMSASIGDYSGRMAEILAGPNTPGARQRLDADQKKLEALNKELHAPAEVFLGRRGRQTEPLVEFVPKGGPAGAKPGPTRLTLIPIYAATFASMSSEDAKWWAEQQAAFPSVYPGGGLPVRPPFDQVSFEAINFMDGKRSTSEIAGLLAVEFNRDFDAAWVDRLVGILVRLNLVKAN
jgi:hypothetical protein